MLWGKKLGQENTAQEHCSASPPHPQAPSLALACFWMSHQKEPPLAFGETAPRKVSCMSMALGSFTPTQPPGTPSYMSSVGCSQPITQKGLYMHIETDICVCVYVCLYACVYIYVHMYTYMYMCMCVYVYVYVYVYAYVYAYVYIYIYIIYLYLSIYLYISISVSVSTYIYIYLYISICVHLYNLYIYVCIYI